MPTNNSLFLDFPPENNLTPDGGFLITPEELANGPSILPVSDTNPATLDRLSERDEDKIPGCRRTNTILALEAEYNTYVSPYMPWGVCDEFCIHEGSYIYYKPWIQQQIDADLLNIQDLLVDQINLDIVNNVLGFDFSTARVNYKTLIEEQPAGLPLFQDQTLSFFRLESVGDTEITLDTMTRDVLDAVKASFTDDLNPYLCNMGQGLYIKDGAAYYAGVLAWVRNPTMKLGVFMDNSVPSENYPDSETTAYFFAFEPLTAEQISFVTALYNLEKSDTSQRLEIVYL
jgi:hypothetical protein